MKSIFQFFELSVLIVLISWTDSFSITNTNEIDEQNGDLDVKSHLDLFKEEVDKLKFRMDMSYKYLVFLYHLNSIADSDQFGMSMGKSSELRQNGNDIPMKSQEEPMDEVFSVMERTETDKRYFDGHLNCLKNCSSTAVTICPDNTFKDNLYLFKLTNLRPFFAYCFYSTEDKETWTIIQRREDGSQNFNRDWLDYKLGFGNVYGEYWIGLERLHVMTAEKPYILWVLLQDYGEEKRYARYSEFSIGSESEGYKLHIQGYDGNAGNSLIDHNKMKFSTFDRDNDIDKRNCARDFRSGWWYHSCYVCNLNGVFASYSNQNVGIGVNWNLWHFDKSLKYAHMAIRPA